MNTHNFLLILENIINQKKVNPTNSYTSHLFQAGIDRILKKVGEEATEFIIDAKNRNKKRAIEEAADLIFHLMVSLNELDISLQDIIFELEERHKKASKGSH